MATDDYAKDEHKTYLCFHAHFYQPPRQNPWLDFVEIQDSAHPAHDWNERIMRECYYPMAHARILDSKGNVKQIVNNYEKISFNIGPTLFAWIEKHQPDLYEAIIKADQKSRQDFGGHGNAIAQVYNHMIMPLADERDARTQIRWSIGDFERRFNRRPEGMWLAETACHPRILKMLVQEGIRFTILAPSQAEQVRKIGGREWYDVSRGNIDPFRPYRFFMDGGKLSMDIFFYDGPLSQAVSFDNLLFDAKILVGHLKKAVVKDYENQLINLATDGEVYGHHKAFGERALGYLLFDASEENGFEIVNYGYFLEKHPAEWEVKIKSGEEDLGTSWSCAHGVRRWYDDCGCHTGGDPKWNQKWRKPLREALDFVAERAKALFERRGGEIFHDPWAARDRYVQLLLDYSEQSLNSFLGEVLKPQSLGKDNRTLALKLLEMQKQAMYMYTSCGWFFSEISGTEGVQILRHAARCVELYQNVCGENIEDRFLDMLGRAPSNIAEFKNGAGVYERFVRPSVVSFDRVAAHFAMMSIFEEMHEENTVYAYTVQLKDFYHETHGNMTLAVGHVNVKSNITFEERELMFVVFRSGLFEFRCSVKLYTDSFFFNNIRKEIPELLQRKHLMDIVRFIDEKFSLEYYSIRDVFLEERRRILYLLAEETIRKFADSFTSLYDDHRGVLYMFTTAGLKIPKEFKMAAQYTLNERFYFEIEKAVSGEEDILTQFKKADAIMRVATEWGIQMESPETIQLLHDTILERMIEITRGGVFEEVERVAVILEEVAALGVDCDISKAQELFYGEVIQKNRIASLDSADSNQHRLREAYKKLARSLGFSKELI